LREKCEALQVIDPIDLAQVAQARVVAVPLIHLLLKVIHLWTYVPQVSRIQRAKQRKSL